MTQAVKANRRYVSPKRREQARQTRRDILAAARRRFVDEGYSTTTVGMIAREAGVAIQTVYVSVGNKRALLWSVLETAVAGDDAPRTLEERFRDEIEDEVDQRGRLQRAVRSGGRVMDRSADVYRIMRSAATSDPEIASALAEVEDRRYQDAAAIVRLIAGGDGFSPGMDERTATDLWFALTSYEVYELLIRGRRWSKQRYEIWITRALEPLVGDGPAGRDEHTGNDPRASGDA